MIKIAGGKSKMHCRRRDCFTRIYDSQPMTLCGRPQAKSQPVLDLQYYFVACRPAELSKNVLPAGLVADDEIGIVVSKALVLGEFIASGS